MRFVNEFLYDETAIREIQTAVIQERTKWSRIFLIAAGVLAVLLAILTRQPGSLVALFVIVFLFQMMSGRRNESIRNEVERLKTLYHGDASVQMHYEIDEEKVLVERVGHEEGRREILWDRFEKWLETKNYLVMIFKGNMTAIVRKDAFREGCEEDFRHFLQDKKH